MSTLLLPCQSDQTEQLYFSWAQPELRTSRKRPAPSPKLLPSTDGKDNRVDIEGSDRVQQSGSAFAKARKAILPRTAVVQQTLQGRTLTKSTRVGEVRLGNVMLALLKQYGITDEEIEAGLASVSAAGPTVGQLR